MIPLRLCDNNISVTTLVSPRVPSLNALVGVACCRVIELVNLSMIIRSERDRERLFDL